MDIMASIASSKEGLSALVWRGEGDRAVAGRIGWERYRRAAIGQKAQFAANTVSAGFWATVEPGVSVRPFYSARSTGPATPRQFAFQAATLRFLQSPEACHEA